MSDTPVSGRPERQPTATETRPARPPASRSIHAGILEQAIPDWLTEASPQRRAALKAADSPLPDWYRQASAAQRKALDAALTAHFSAQNQLDQALVWLQDIDTFAAPLLRQALKAQHNIEPDLDKTFLVLRKPVEVGILGVDIDSFEVLNLPLLQAALHNFEAAECEPGAFHASSGFRATHDSSGEMQALDLALTIEQFTTLCRTLDVGKQYQAYLEEHLHPKDSAVETALREAFTGVQKAALRVAAERAVLEKHIEAKDHASILEIIDGQLDPRQGDKRIWFRDLGLMDQRMTGCIWFSIGRKFHHNPNTEDVLLYIPNDPEQPLKRYQGKALRASFKQRFTARGGLSAGDPSPTAYQRFFSQFVAYGDLPRYFSQFTDDTADQSFGDRLAPFAALLNDLVKGINPFSFWIGVKELPPPRAVPQVPNDDPYLAPLGMARKGAGRWADNVDPFNYLFDQYRSKLLDDARHHAVPTADVDARVRSRKFSSLLNIGMLVLTAISMFVPVLGEIMMGVMLAPLLKEAFTGIDEWSRGDRKAAKTHLLDVAENLLVLALTVGAGKGLARLTAVKAEPLIEDMHPVTLPNGKTRLWKPDLQGYESDVGFTADVSPDASGQYELNGKHYLRLEGKYYEQFYDPQVAKWRIRHPSDAEAYQPLLEHNRAGAWRLTQERPLTWDRLKLLRRMGHRVAAYSDEQLLKIGEISGLSDSALRKMHVDNALPPPQLTEAMRLFEADLGVEQVIEQVASGQATDGRYLCILPLLTEMPRWPRGRVLEVFENTDLTGDPVKYGGERLVPGEPLKAPIRISRADLRSGELLTRVLATLDEAEILRLLGGEPARVRELRPEELRKQLVDYARTRRPALFEILHKRSEPTDARVERLQRVCPGLSEPAAQAVLAQSSGEELARLDSSAQVPLHLQEMARFYAREGRLTRAFAGLYSENMALPDSARLALHALAKLPGWPDNLRLEIRSGGIEGPLIDGIGSPSAALRKYLVKRGPSYQAFNERGESLNSLPPYGDNFYASIMHALPDEARTALGIAEVGRSAELQQAIIDHATGQRGESLQVLEGARTPRAPSRIAPTQFGYPASGEGPGLAPTLVARVRDVYTGLTDEQARAFVLEQWRAGQTEQQIMSLLNNKLREWDSLDAALTQWCEAVPRGLSATLRGREFIAMRIRTCWRMAPVADQFPQFSRLDIVTGDALPALTADFSHIRELTLMAPGATNLLARFANVEKLVLSEPAINASSLFDVLAPLQKLKELNIGLSSMEGLSANLARVPGLEKLDLLVLPLSGQPAAAEVLDVSALRNLQSLVVSNENMREWPGGVLDLPQLQHLDLRSTGVDSLPAPIYTGHETLLSGLSLKWSAFSRDAFRPVYQHLIEQPLRAGDLDGMLKQYCRGQFKRFGGVLPSFYEELAEPFVERWPDLAQRYEAIEALGDQYAALERFDSWVGDPFDLHHGGYVRSALAQALKSNWRAGVLQRFNTAGSHRLNIFAAGQAPVLELAGVGVDTLPTLPAEGFSHVTTLRLKGFRVPAAALRDFLRTFSNVKTLSLKDCGLGELPLHGADLPALEHLDLHGNPLTTLDVSALPGLKALDLSRTALREWPGGTENLTQLNLLDLRNSQISTIPAAVLARDELLINSNLTGAPLTAPAQAELAAARLRIEQARGLQTGTLGRFSQDVMPSEFPPRETGSSIMRRLLPLLPALEEGADQPTLVKRLQTLDPRLSEEQATQAIERLRNERMTEAQIGRRLDSGYTTHEALTRRLNDWLYIRETRGDGWQISSHTRRLAAQRIIDCWRDGLIAPSGMADTALSLDGLQLGDLPALPLEFGHVGELDLTGVRLSDQGSNNFLEAFPNLTTLRLNGQALEALPGAVAQMSQLERLELSGVGLVDPSSLYFTLATVDNLQWLDLSNNVLETFSVELFDRLRGLDLRNNRLRAWPDGVLDATSLTSLNLSGNAIAAIPEDALDGSHPVLIEGTDLSDNRLSLESLQRLYEYTGEEENGLVLGMPFADIVRMMDDYVSGSEGESSSETDSENEGGAGSAEDTDSDTASEVEEDVADLAQQALLAQLRPWLENLPAEEIAARRATWAHLAAEPGNGNFFHLLNLMRITEEFRLHRADLTRRVWGILEAAEQHGDLRQDLFEQSRTHDTCIDGRTLAFSELEVRVYVYNALLDVAPGLEQKGQALLTLSRRLFRLDAVESLAREAGRQDPDVAEVRLRYRIGLTGGWPDGLTLPGQPRSMSFRRPLDGEELTTARQQVLDAENSERFYEVLISRDYWVAYLEERYPQVFAELRQRADANLAAVEERHADLNSAAYSEDLNMVGIENATAKNLRMIELSRQEVQANTLAAGNA
jgi:Leucine-rich repeat (LRR) protein